MKNRSNSPLNVYRPDGELDSVMLPMPKNAPRLLGVKANNVAEAITVYDHDGHLLTTLDPWTGVIFEIQPKPWKFWDRRTPHWVKATAPQRTGRPV